MVLLELSAHICQSLGRFKFISLKIEAQLSVSNQVIIETNYDLYFLQGYNILTHQQC